MIVTNYAIKFRTAVLVFTVAATFLGLQTYFSMPREGAPDITIPYVFVTAPYEGVAPAEIENLIAIPLERKLKDLQNVKEIRSVSSEGVAALVIEFTPKENLNNALQRVKDKIDLAGPDLPKDLNEPIVDVINFGADMPVLTMALSGELETERLRKLAEDLQEAIENVGGVKQASVTGAREREIRIELDPARLVACRVTLGAVIRAVAAENKTISAGNLEMQGGKFQVRIPGEFSLVSEMRRLVIAVKNGRPVYLSDVATVADTFKDVSSVSRLNGKPCVSIHVKKRSGENTLTVIARIKRTIREFHLPPGVELTITHDESEFIASMVQELENSMISGSVLVILVLLFSLGWRNSLFVGMAIPLSMFISFVIMFRTGITLNFLVLFGLVMAAGMLVDDAVVIVENIFRNRSLGLSRREAALRGASEVAWPVTTSTLTAAVAFWPLMAWPDVMGQFMRYLPLTLILTRMASLFVALIINPAMCSYYVTAESSAAQGEGGAPRHPILDAYERFLRGAMAHRGVVLTIGVALFVLTAQLYGRFGRGVELFPDTEPRRATVEVKYPQGTHIEKTDASLREIEKKLFQYKDVKFFLSNVGVGGDQQSAGAHLGNISMEFLPADKRGTNTLALVAQLRADIGELAGADVKVDREKMGPPSGAPVSIEVSGEDFAVLADLAGDILRAVKPVPGLVDLRDDLEEARPEFQFRVDRQKMALLGLDTDTVGTFLRAAIYGMEVSRFRAGEDEYDITIRLPASARNSADLLNGLRIPLEGGRSVPLSSLGRVVYTGGRGDIRRKDEKRVITLSADIQGRSIDVILADVKAAVGRVVLPPGYAVYYSGENKDMVESSDFLAKAFGIGIALIAVILVLEFNSVVLPLIILATVLLAMMGVMWGLMICRMRFGVIMTGLGVITLAGVVVNNGIVLIDCIIHKRETGLSAAEAAIAGGRQRLRPVLLTAAAAILGLIPMAVGWTVEIHTWPWKFVAGAESSAWWAPMAVAVIFGLSVATVLTLVFVPVMYSVADSMISGVKRRVGWKSEET